MRVEIKLEEVSVGDDLDPDAIKIRYKEITDISELQKYLHVGTYQADFLLCEDGFVVRIPLDSMNLGEYVLYTKIINITVIMKGEE
jgi:hypothetical protein